MTRVTGTQLRRAIKTWEARRDLAVGRFTPSLTAFNPNDEDKDPKQVAAEILQAETGLAKLLTAQGQYNLLVKVTVDTETVTLSEAIKRVGGLSRNAKRWKEASARPKRPHWREDNDPAVRDKDKEYAQRTVSFVDAGELGIQAEREAQKFRDAIGSANGTAVDVDLDGGLLD